MITEHAYFGHQQITLKSLEKIATSYCANFNHTRYVVNGYLPCVVCGKKSR